MLGFALLRKVLGVGVPRNGRSRPSRDGFSFHDAVRMVLRESASVPLFDTDRALWTLIGGFFTAAGVFACVRIDHVADAVIADLEHIGADILADTTPGAKIGIDFRNTHSTPPLGLANEAI